MNSESRYEQPYTEPFERRSATEGLPAPYDQRENTSKSSSSKKKGRPGFGRILKLWRKRDVDLEQTLLADLQQTDLRRYSFAELCKATERFDQSRLLGRGAYGDVYKGSLEGGTTVAIKVSTKPSIKEIVAMYVVEIKMLNRLRHPNLIKLYGWFMVSDQFPALVYEHMSNGNLDSHLHPFPILSNQSKPSLPWEVRYSKIVVGLASALLYLQEGLDDPVVHRDVKSSNVLLDSDFNPKLGDFGIAKVVDGDPDAELPTAAVIGTPGYVDPEYLTTNKFGKRCDIYAFGVVAMEIASGRRAIDRDPVTGKDKHLSSWVRSLHEKGRIMDAADPSLHGVFDVREMERLLLVGLWCAQPEPKSRPSMELVHRILNFEAPMPSDFITGSDASLQCAIEEKGMMPDFLTDIGDYDTVRHRLPEAASTSQTELIPTSLFASTRDNTTRLFEEFEAGEPSPVAVPSSQAVFFGIPRSAASPYARKDHHKCILRGYLNSLECMLRSEEGLPRYGEALEINRYTQCLELVDGPPLDDWNEIAQLVLRALRERDELLRSNTDSELIAANMSQSSLISRVNECVLTLEEDATELEGAKARLARARRVRDSVAARLREVYLECISMQEEVMAIEERIERKRRCQDIPDLFQSIHLKLRSLTCDS